MNALNMPTAEQFDVQNMLLASIASNTGTGGMTINNWDDVQRLVRMGLHTKMFVVGDQLVANYNGTPKIWDIIGINHDTPTDKKYTNSLTIQAHDCLLNAMFSAPQGIAYTENELPAGEQILTFNGAQYKFTTTQPIPAKGQVFATTWVGDTYVPTKVTIYGANRTTIIEAGIDIITATGTDTITEVNNHVRCRYGSNNYKESSIKQWLNSEMTTFAWVSQTKFDRPPTGYPTAGFLKLLDADLAAAIGSVDKVVSKNTITDGGGIDNIKDKVFLLSRTEVHGGNEIVTPEGSAYPYYSALSASPTTDTLAGRIKYLSGEARYWWLRSPSVGTSYSPRGVNPPGIVYNNLANIAYGAAPACCIV